MNAVDAPLVSVIMPAWNAADTLADSMHSALAQTHAQVQLVVIDDCSSDATREIAQGIAASDARVLVVRQPANAGVAAARNAGIEAATGSHIAFLDSDDRWHPDKLRRQLAHLQASGETICYAGYRRVDEAGRELSQVSPPPRVDYPAMLRSNRIGNLTGIYDRRLGDAQFRRIGHEDYVFWLDMVRRAGHASRVPDPEPLADYLVRGKSLSGNKLKAARWQWRIYRDTQGLDPMRAGWYFLHYAGNALAKRR